MMKFRQALALSLAVFISSVSVAQTVPQIPVEQFFKKDAFGSMRLSPTGEYIAVTVPLQDRTNLIILRRSDMKQTGFVGLPSKTYVASFYWVNPTRILFTIGENKYGGLVAPSASGEIYGVNVDGSGQGNPLVGFRADSLTPGGTQIRKKSNYVFASMLDTLKDEDDFVLIQVYVPGNPHTEVHRMNVKNGSRTTVAKAPLRRASFLTDNKGIVRFVVGADNENRSKTYFRNDAKSEWVLLNEESVTQKAVMPIGMSSDNQTAYLNSEEESGPNGLYAFDTKTQKKTLIVKDDNVDPNGYLSSPGDDSLFAVNFMDGYPRTHYIDSENPFAKINKSVQASLKNAFVVPISYTDDGNLALYLAYADNIPRSFYIYDRKTSSLSYVAENASWFKPEQLAQTEAYQITARDGLQMDAYLTLPKGSNGKNLPLIVNPHGGPFGPYDSWGYNPELQLLANRGYAVLQVNFRGSGNYGRAFVRKGHKQWGGTMQDDLTDATRWAIKTGIANPRRICIYGASYGGYASLMGVAKEPDLYACAIGNVGVYDMNMMYGRGDIQDRNDGSGINFLEETLGRDNLSAISPTSLASKIKVPVLMFAGREDERAPPEHTEAMQRALGAAGKSVQVKIYKGEGHGNSLIENQIDQANLVLSFLDKHIGPGSQQAK